MSAKPDSEPTPLNLQDFETAALRLLPRMVYDYYAGGANDETLLQRSRQAWDSIHIRYRVMRDVSKRSLACDVLGHALEWPVMIAPMAFQQMAHTDGELATARAARESGTGMILSTLSTISVEDVSKVAPSPFWFQLYIEKDRDATAALVQRAQKAGCNALVLTVDTPLLGRRERDMRNAFHITGATKMPHISVSTSETLTAQDGALSALARYVATHWDSSINWRDLEWLRSITSLPILVKGVVRGDDAAMAMQHGAAGVIVSNHGGRQLDASIETARALLDVAEAMDGRGALLVDGGIRRGTDVLKAIALGAQAVLLGRPVLWGLSVAGEDGVARVLRMLRDECDLAMALSGCKSVAEITPDLVVQSA